MRVGTVTGAPVPARLLRPPVEPSVDNGLRETSRLMVDKIASMPRSRLGSRMGRLAAEDLVRLDRAMLVFLGLAVTPRMRRA